MHELQSMGYFSQFTRQMTSIKKITNAGDADGGAGAGADVADVVAADGLPGLAARVRTAKPKPTTRERGGATPWRRLLSPSQSWMETQPSSCHWWA